MADSADDFGERAATTAEVSDWVDLVRSGRTTGYRQKVGQYDRERPIYPSNRASSEGDD